jgi:5'-3' exonuclease
VGNGLRFFYSQLITGDTVDNIPGLPRGGPRLAFSTLDGLETEEEMFRAVEEAYKKKFPDDYRERILEQARLLWMVRELDAEGKPVMWELPYE